MLKNKSAVIAAAATMTAMAGGGTLLAVPASAGTQVPLAGSWHVVKTVSGPNFPEFTAVTAASGRNAWAFESATASNARPQAFEMRGGKWLSKPFPGLAGESVLSASASSITNVWAVTTNFIKGHSRILRFNGDSWAQVRSFSREAGSVLALRNTDVWLFGTAFSAATQAVHYNGHAWTASRGSRGLLGGSALSASSIWAYGQTSVSHWNGSKWTAASVKKLLPKNTELCGSRLTGIEAVAAKSVFAIGTGGCQDQLGPFVLLHFNGSKWSRIALKPSLGPPRRSPPTGAAASGSRYPPALPLPAAWSITVTAS